MKSKFSLILDFDSTIISVETLDYLADISTKNIIKKNKLIDKISHYTDLAMNGDITFQESLEIRLKLMQINKDDIDSSIELIQKKIDSSFIDNIDFFKKYIDSVFIVSGGFKSIIHPVLNSIFKGNWNIYANEFVFDNHNIVSGVENHNPLSASKGKVKLVESLNLNNDIIIVGDGYTDYEIKKFNLAKYFLAYTGHAKRKNVIKNADFKCSNFYDVIDFLNKKYN